VTNSPPDDFGYAVTDFFTVRARFGGAAELRNLVAQAHLRRLRVILDFAPNHVSKDHPYYADAAEKGPRSAYFDFFARTAAGQVAHYFDWEHLKNLNYDNAEVQRLIIEAFAYWVREFDVDGFRVDAPWGPRQRAPEFWPRWREELKRIKPDLFLLAEASARDPYYFRNGFDAAYDWTEKLGKWAWFQAFEDRVHTAGRLRAAIAASSAGGRWPLVFRFLNNNDTGPRFITRYGLPRTRVAAAMLLTLPGVPALYAGDEIGAEFSPYDEPHPLSWDDVYSLRPWYARLIRLREKYSALRSRELQLLEVAPRDQVLAYLRPGHHGDDMMILLNYGSAAVRVELPRRARSRTGRRAKVWDVLHDRPLAFRGGQASVLLPGNGVQIFQIR